MARFPLFGTDQTGRTPHVTAQRRINMFVEPRQDNDRNTVSYHQRPGLVFWMSLGQDPVRGMHVVDETLYAVHRNRVFAINNARQLNLVGKIRTRSGRVGMEDNGTELIIVDGDSGYIYDTVAETLTEITDEDFPKANTVAFQGGRFIVDNDGTGQWYLSDSYAGSSWDATKFASAESFPDDIFAVYVDQGDVFLFGDESMEVWNNVGTTDFPFTRVDGASAEMGLAARWSIAKLGSTIAWLAKNRTGEVRVMRLSGYTPQMISTPEMEYTINNYTNVGAATGLGYTVNGHSFYQLNFTQDNASWVYDETSGLWSELQYSAAGARHRGEIALQFVNRTIISDYMNGNLYEISSVAYDDDGVEFSKELTGRHIFDEEQVAISRLWLDMDTGVGTATGDSVNPQMMLQISKDGGHSWGTERLSAAGKIGEYDARAIWRRLGRGYEWTFRVRNSDAVPVAISGAWVDLQQGG